MILVQLLPLVSLVCSGLSSSLLTTKLNKEYIMNIITNLVKVIINLTRAACIITKYKFLCTKDKLYVARTLRKYKVKS